MLSLGVSAKYGIMGKMLRLVIFIFPFSFLCLLLASTLCTAQESVEAQQRVIERYRELLIQSPKKGAIFDRVYGHYVDTGQSVLLYQDCQKATQDQPTKAGAWMLLGLVAERRGKTEQAAEAFQTAANLEPNNHLPLLYLGDLLLNQRRTFDAITAFEQANERLQTNSGSKVDMRAVLQALALAYSRFGDPQKSLEMWNQLAGHFPNDPDILVQVAESMEFDGKLDEALKQYRRLITLTDDNFERIRLSFAAIDLMLRLGDNESALRDLDALLGYVNTDSYLADAVRDRIDRIFERGRDQNRHIEFYQKRFAQEPNDTASLLRLVRIFQQADRSTEAETLLLSTIKVSPSNIPLRLALIDLLVARRDINAAIEQFQAIDRFAPMQTDHLIRWGTLVLQNSGGTETVRRTEAAKIWNRIAENLPNDPVAAVLVADLFDRNKFSVEAERLYQRAVALRPNEFSYQENLATFYHHQRQKDKVLETLRSKDRAEVGRVLLALGYVVEASHTLREAVQTDPQNWMVQYRYLESLLLQNTPESGQSIRELFANAERQIVNDEQYALFLQQEVQLLRSVQRIVEAVRIVQSTVETSSSVRSLWHLAVLHQSEANYLAAVAAMEKGLELARLSGAGGQDGVIPLLRLAAELYEQSGDTSKAIALYQTLVQADPARSGNHWQQIITLQIQRGELSQALESTRNLLGRGTENADRLRFVADLLLSVNRRDEAIGLLRQALVHEPGNTDVLRVLAQTLADSEQHEEAIELFWRLYERLEHFPAKLSVIEILATEYNRLGRDEDLVERVQLLSRNPDRRRESMQALVRVLMIQEDYEESQSVLEDLLDFPEDSQAAAEFTSLWVLRELVSLAERQDDFATAARFQEMLAQKSSDPKEEQHLFFLYDKLGDTARTRKLFFAQVLRQEKLESRLELIDTMIRRGQHDIVSQVLDFLDIHEPPQWQNAFRRILVEAQQNKPVGDLVRLFRETPFVDKPQERENVSPSLVHPTFVFSGVAPAELNASLVHQDRFLQTLFLPEKRQARRNPEQEQLPEDFADVPTFQDARCLALGWLLREAMNRDLAANSDNPTVMRNFRNTVEELREMLPADSTKYDVLIERLRLEVWLLDMVRFDERLQEQRVLEWRVQVLPARSLKMQIDEHLCQQTIMQIIRNSALDGVSDWQSALFQIFVNECIDELVAERFKAVLPSGARLSERLHQILDNLCYERRTPSIPAEERNAMIDFATHLVKQSSASYQASQRQRPVPLAEKTDRLLALWSQYIEKTAFETQAQTQCPFAARYRVLLWILHAQNRETDVSALEQSLRKAAKINPRWFAAKIYLFSPPIDEDVLLFPALTGYETLETQLTRIKDGTSGILPSNGEKNERLELCQLLFSQLGGANYPDSLLRRERLQRYDIFTQAERVAFGAFTPLIWEGLHIPAQSQTAQFFRQLFGIDPQAPSRVQTLAPDQMGRLTELDRSLQQMTDFAFWVLDELKIEPTDFSSPLPTTAAQNVTLTRYRSELQGDRPVDRTVIYSLIQNANASGNFSAVEELFFRIILLRRAMDTKTKYLGVKVEDRVMPIRENYTSTLGQLLESKRWSTAPSDRAWGNHLSSTFGDLLPMSEQTANRPALGSDAELMQIVQRLETELNKRTLTHTENLALALLCVRLQRFEEAAVMLDSMELTSSADLSAREWILADLARKRAKPDSPLMKRGGEAANRLTNFRLSEKDLLNLVPVLRFFYKDEEAQRILDHLSITVSDRRLLADLFYRLIPEGAPQKENAAKVAKRILTNPAFLQNSRRLTADVYLLESAIKVLKEHNQAEPVIPILENRLRGHRDQTDSRILLATLYLTINRQEEAKTLVLELAQNPTAEPERRQRITSMLLHFGLQRELETMNRLLLERNSR